VESFGQLQGYRVSSGGEQESNENRADPFAAQCEHGHVKLIEAPWNASFIDELCAFPNGAHDDRVDAATISLAKLLSSTGCWLTSAIR
jgi:predicted phage terminase large subunit-like protein